MRGQPFSAEATKPSSYLERRQASVVGHVEHVERSVAK
jgi:hypothetical protein